MAKLIGVYMLSITLTASIVVPSTRSDSAPTLVKLTRETSPVRRQGKVASFKTSYSGVLKVGSPAQDFRVVFDTGSGHVVIPAAECTSETCMKHMRYDITASQTALAINADGRPVGEMTDQIAIGYGSGEVTGEFVRDKVCLGENLCVSANVVMAIEMSPQPFKSFNFDGIVGLGLSSLAIADSFSLFRTLIKSNSLQMPHFGVFLTEGEEGEDSEIAFGGHNVDRLLEPLQWVSVDRPEFGHWEVHIKAIRIDGQTLRMCEDGTCRGVVDSGTSHLGVPAPYNTEVSELLQRPAGDLLDCRLVQAPEIEIELDSINLTLHSRNYMRRLPLRDGVTVGSPTGVVVEGGPQNNSPATVHSGTGLPEDEVVSRHCSPRITRVSIPEPLGPKLFILGEPVLHRYYTVFDYASLKVGFGLANNRQNTGLSLIEGDGRGTLPADVETLLMQQTMSVSGRGSSSDDGDEMVFFQMTVSVVIKRV